MLPPSPSIMLWMLAFGHATASPSTIAVAPIADAGTPDTVEPARIRDAVLEGLRRGELEIDALEGQCPDRACWIDRARDSEQDYVLFPEIEHEGPDHRLRIDVVRARSGETIATIQQLCEICGEDELLTTSADLAAELLPRLQRLGLEPAVVTVDGRPSGATVELDGTVVGQLPWQGEVEAGEHTLRVSADGHQPLRRTVSATAGVQERLSIELRADAPPPPPSAARTPLKHRRALLITAASLSGLGILGLATGAGLFGVDGRPYRPGCPSDAVDVNGRCPQMYETTAPAVAAVAVGGAALVAGVTLLVYTLRRRGRGSAGDDIARGYPRLGHAWAFPATRQSRPMRMR